jgi:hypothetical protein
MAHFLRNLFENVCRDIFLSALGVNDQQDQGSAFEAGSIDNSYTTPLTGTLTYPANFPAAAGPRNNLSGFGIRRKK